MRHGGATAAADAIRGDFGVVRNGRASAAGTIFAMQDEADPVFQRMCELLESFNVRNVALLRQTHITTDLEIDSVAVLDLIMEIEDEYGISFPMNLISEIRTIGDLVNAIHQLTDAK